MKKIIFILFFAVVGNAVPMAQFDCYTHSSGILFKAVGSDEKATMNKVVTGCIDHPNTKESECVKNVACFPQ